MSRTLGEATPLVLRVRRVQGPISTDDIMPARYKHTHTEPARMAPHVFEDAVPGFAASVNAGDALVSDAILGIGSSREQAISALQSAGIRALLAPSFGHILYRNAWNLGVPAIVIDTADLVEGETVELRLDEGILRSSAVTRTFTTIPVEMRRICEAGGLLSVLKSTGVGHAWQL